MQNMALVPRLSNSVSLEGIEYGSFYIPRDIVIFMLEKVSLDRQTLRQCTHVSRGWNSECRRHVFSAIEVYLTKEGTNPLFELLLKDSKTVSFIRQLRLKTALIRCGLDGAFEFQNCLLQGLIEATKSNENAGLFSLDIAKTYWLNLHIETQLFLINLLKTSSKLNTLCLPVCRYCSFYRFLIDNSRNLTQLRHLILRSSGGYCNHDTNQIANPSGLSAFFKALGPVPTESKDKILIETVKLECVGPLKKCFLYRGCPLEFSNLRELHLVGIEELRTKQSALSVQKFLKPTGGSLESLIWKIVSNLDPYYLDWRSSQDLIHNPPGGLILKRLPRIYVRCLTLFLPLTKSFGADKAFSTLKSRLGIQFEELEKLNLVYLSGWRSMPAEYYRSKLGGNIDDPHWRLNEANKRLKRTLRRAEYEFKAVCRKHKISDLGSINLLIEYDEDSELVHLRSSDDRHWIPSQHWTPSRQWSMVIGCAPSMHATGKLYVRTTSVCYGKQKASLKMFPSNGSPIYHQGFY